MELFGHYRIYWSAPNGLIIFNKKSGEIFVRGVKQTSVRYPQMWADALADCLGGANYQNILLLGLGGGGLLPALHQRYPTAHVTAVEHDKVMATLAQELHRGDSPYPDVITGDAQTVLKNLTKKFDLVLVDLFLGGNPPAFVKQQPFWHDIKKILIQSGAVLLNLAGSTGFEGAARASFAHVTMRMSKQNRFLALYD